MANNYKKLIVFDFNLDWNKYDANDKRYKDINLIYSLLYQAIKYQPVVITTSGWFGDGLDFIKKIGIKNGYLIANAGAVIYDIAKGKILNTNVMNPDDVKTLVHHGIMENINVVISTINAKFVYVSDRVSYQRLSKNLYSPYTEIQDYDQLQDILNSNEVIDVAFINRIETGKNQLQRELQSHLESYFENEINDLGFKVNQTSPFIHVSCKKSTKLIGVQKVMNYTSVEHINDILYIGCTCINKECYQNFKNKLISSNPDFLVELVGTKKPLYISNEINNLSLDFGRETNSFWK